MEKIASGTSLKSAKLQHAKQANRAKELQRETEEFYHAQKLSAKILEACLEEAKIAAKTICKDRIFNA